MEKSLSLDRLFELLKLEEREVLNVYEVGSRAWGTYKDSSDYDFVIVMSERWFTKDKSGTTLVQVAPEEMELRDQKVMIRPGIDVMIYNRSLFEECLYKWHVLYVVACLSLPKHNIWLEKIKFELGPDTKPQFSLEQFRSTVSRECSRTWVKAKKKTTVEKNPQLTKKDVVHTFRDLLFALQIIKHNRITNIAEANSIHFEVMNTNYQDWKEIESRWKKQYNSLSSDLRKAVPTSRFKPFETFLANPNSEQEALQLWSNWQEWKKTEAREEKIDKVQEEEQSDREAKTADELKTVIDKVLKRLIENETNNNKKVKSKINYAEVEDYAFVRTGHKQKERAARGDWFCNTAIKYYHEVWSKLEGNERESGSEIKVICKIGYKIKEMIEEEYKVQEDEKGVKVITLRNSGKKIMVTCSDTGFVQFYLTSDPFQ